MEDHQTLQLRLSDTHPDISFFSVYDGHGGGAASTYLSKQLVRSVADLEEPTNPRSLEDCFVNCDHQFLQQPDAHEGSACIVALVRPLTAYQPSRGECTDQYALTIANVGDSRALLIRGADGKVVSLSKDHKPTLPVEHARIVAAGGSVFCGRVNGCLALSRAFGDLVFKMNKERGPHEQAVIVTRHHNRDRV